MAHASCPQPRSRRSMVLALLATTAMASLLGACSQTDKLFSRSTPPEDANMSASEAATATSQWAQAYMKNPQDPEMALGYARALRALGSKDRSLEVLKRAYQTNPTNGEVAAELGRVALDMGQMNVASQALESAEAQGVHDWKTLSAEGTLYAKKGEHSEAQRYFLAALQQKPDSPVVINNLALSYALDGKAKESEELLRKAVASGQGDKRIRQNLALVLGLQGKFNEARQVASVDMSSVQANQSMSYLRNMLQPATDVASAAPKPSHDNDDSASDWSPFASNTHVKEAAPVQTASAEPTPVPAKVQLVKPVDEIEEPAATGAKPANSVKAAMPAPPEAKVAQATAEVVTPAPAPAKVAQATAQTLAPAPAKVAQAATAAPTPAPARAKVAQAEMVIPIVPPVPKPQAALRVSTQTAPASLLRADTQ
jgi:Flp pilus assembly protein TadD